MLLGTINGIKVYVFKGDPLMSDKFYVAAMNSLFVRKGTKSYYDTLKALL